MLEVTLSSADKRGSLPANLINTDYSRINDSECASSSVIPSVRLYISLRGARFHHHRLHRRRRRRRRRLFRTEAPEVQTSPQLPDAML